MLSSRVFFVSWTTTRSFYSCKTGKKRSPGNDKMFLCFDTPQPAVNLVADTFSVMSEFKLPCWVFWWSRQDSLCDGVKRHLRLFVDGHRERNSRCLETRSKWDNFEIERWLRWRDLRFSKVDRSSGCGLWLQKRQRMSLESTDSAGKAAAWLFQGN